MAGYANRLIHRDFPELTAEGDPMIHVILRNPRLVPPGELRRRDIKAGDDGTEDEDDKLTATYELMARLIVGWHVYDATFVDPANPDGDQPRLKLPATGASVGKLPSEIILALGDEMAKVNPQARSSSPEEAATSTK